MCGQQVVAEQYELSSVTMPTQGTLLVLARFEQYEHKMRGMVTADLMNSNGGSSGQPEVDWMTPLHSQTWHCCKALPATCNAVSSELNSV